MILQQIAELIAHNRSFLVLAHEGPDGDAIGSTLGLAQALRENGKDVVAYNVDGLPQSMDFLPGCEALVSEIPADQRFDVAFVLDAGDLGRIGLPAADLCETLVNIDHHPFSDFGDICYLDTSASATAVLIYRLLKVCDFPVSLATAKSLYLGLLADTGSFRYSSANREAFSVASDLVACGVDPWEVASTLYESYPSERMRLLGYVLPTLEISECGHYASVSMKLQDLSAAGACEEHADGFVNYARAIRGVEVALFFSQVEDRLFKVSFRSRGAVDVGTLARELGGGGHHNAAGARLQGDLAMVKAKVYRHIDQLL
jgi:phosphoesterase RecJ-like protein